MILSASAHLRPMERGRYSLQLDLKPALSEEKLKGRLLREIEARHTERPEQLIRSLLPGAMVNSFVKKLGINPDKRCSEITKTERQSIQKLLKSYTLTVKDFRPIEEAIVTSGGVCVKEINPKTMASLLVRGLYFAGEVIDVDAYTGGFNLQSAFSTGVLAGESD